MKVKILGVKVDKLNLDQSVDLVLEWLKEAQNPLKSFDPKLIVTPNIEFLILAQKDHQFREILNQADLAIPDSSRFGWLQSQLNDKDFFSKSLKWFLFPFRSSNFPVVTGVDLMERLIQEAASKGFSIGLLGGKRGVAQRLSQVLKHRHPSLRLSFARPGGMVNAAGEMTRAERLPKTDILFVAFGQGKQEKWMEKNKDSAGAKILMGVGGGFDFLSGDIARAPVFMRLLGLEWLFRLIIQPWRLSRQLQILKFIGRLLIGSKV